MDERRDESSTEGAAADTQQSGVDAALGDSSGRGAHDTDARPRVVDGGSFAVPSHEAADESRRGGGCFLLLAIVSTAAFLWKWWDVGDALEHGHPVRIHMVLVPFYEWLGRPGILLCGGLTTALFAALAIAGFTGRMRGPDAGA